jgi:hypothetical protein
MWQVRMFVRTEEWKDDLIMKRENISMEKEDKNVKLVMTDLSGEELPLPSDGDAPTRIPSLGDLEVQDLEQLEESSIIAENNSLVAEKAEVEILPEKIIPDNEVSPRDITVGGSSELLGFEIEGDEGKNMIGSDEMDNNVKNIGIIQDSVEKDKGSSLVISGKDAVELMEAKESVNPTNKEIKPRWHVVNIDKEMTMDLVIKRLRRFQAAFRAGKIRLLVREMKVEKISAIMLIQRYPQ